jgi:hypothetical protein
MKKTYECIFNDVYGGDGYTRPLEREQKTLARTKTSTKTRDDIGVAVSSKMEEEIKSKKEEQIHTFKYTDGVPVLRLGGSHGKLWGALREIRSNLYMLGDKRFTSRTLMSMIQIAPVWVPLEVLESIQVQELPQILNTKGKNSMVPIFFDVIPRAKCEFSVSYPDALSEHLSILMSKLPDISLLNKRRATIESLKETDESL